MYTHMDTWTLRVAEALSWWGRNATSEAMLHPLALSLMSCQKSRAEQGLPYADRDLFIGSIKGA